MRRFKYRNQGQSPVSSEFLTQQKQRQPSFIKGRSPQLWGLGLLTLVGGTLISASALAANPQHVKRLLKTNQCPLCDLSNADLSETNLFGASLVGANLEGANLSDSNLGSANLSDANLTRANLQGTYSMDAILDRTKLNQSNLIQAYLRKATITHSQFEQAVLLNANLSEAKIFNTNFHKADLSDANLSQWLSVSALSGNRPLNDGSAIPQAHPIQSHPVLP
jgi:uncharacterized protein YjbI with pentapeptide repeats